MTLGFMGASTLAVPSVKAEETKDDKEFVGVLVDTTRCVGCRSCEFACAEANGLPEPDDDDAVLEQTRQQTPSQWTIINSYDTDKGEVFVKKQCMHCNQPACGSACLTKAMLKTKEGPVVWREDKCMGCRFCMVSCPFDIPKFEYDKVVPKIQKCIFCADRLKQGELPACVDACPEEAIVFGKRRELIDEAQTRIYSNPDKYVHQIYGEHDVGGTGWLYLSSVPFEQLGFRTDLGTTAYPEFTKEFLYAVPIVLALWPAFLMGVATTRRNKNGEENEG
jgi:Fe-S-cluster-containing dehydrogenase component